MAAEMKRRLFLLFTLVIFMLNGCRDRSHGDPLGPTQVVHLTIDGETQEAKFDTLGVEINGHSFQMKLALTEQERINGLSHMTHEQIGEGMLFAFDQAQVLGFVMRDCPVPIDIVFLSATGRVIQTHAMQVEAKGTHEIELKRYSSRYPALIALEFQAGTIEKLKLKSGQVIDLPLETLKQRAD